MIDIEKESVVLMQFLSTSFLGVSDYLLYMTVIYYEVKISCNYFGFVKSIYSLPLNILDIYAKNKCILE